MRKLLFYFFLLASLQAQAQVLTGISAKWSDSFREWVIYTEDDEGELRMRWLMDDDWTEWEYRIGEESGTIKLKWPGDPNQWSLRSGSQVVSMRTRWNNDPREWRIEADKNFIIKSRYGNIRDEWQIEDDRYGNFEMITSWEGDPRDWAITDELDESVSIHTKMALVFTVIFNSVPKW